MTVKIYTRSGDTGETGLNQGPRVGKDTLRIEVCGTIDELNAAIGLVRSLSLPERGDRILAEVQMRLFEAGAEVATLQPEKRGLQFISAAQVRWTEETIDSLEEELPSLSHFVLPGGTPPAALTHFARAVCRRTERRLVALMRENAELGIPLSPMLLAFFNRLSDLLFVLARWLNQQAGKGEPAWHGPSQPLSDNAPDATPGAQSVPPKHQQ